MPDAALTLDPGWDDRNPVTLQFLDSELERAYQADSLISPAQVHAYELLEVRSQTLRSGRDAAEMKLAASDTNRERS
jgi:hypothetical protein